MGIRAETNTDVSRSKIMAGTDVNMAAVTLAADAMDDGKTEDKIPIIGSSIRPKLRAAKFKTTNDARNRSDDSLSSRVSGEKLFSVTARGAPSIGGSSRVGSAVGRPRCNVNGF